MGKNNINTISIILGFGGAIISGYLFSIELINERNLIWIILSLVFVLAIITYQDFRKELINQKWDIKRVDEKLKIYDRLSKLEMKHNG
jgi:hypothetical protein